MTKADKTPSVPPKREVVAVPLEVAVPRPAAIGPPRRSAPVAASAPRRPPPRAARAHRPAQSKPADLANIDLNSRLAQPLPMNRFRPNLVVAGCAAFAEDTWPHLRIGDVIFRHAGSCARCPITTTDQFTAVRGKEPLKTLATYRRDPDDPTDVNFGANLIHETKRGTVRVGAEVVLL